MISTVKLYLVSALALVSITVGVSFYYKIKHDAVQQYEYKQIVKEKEKVNRATKADTVSRDCSRTTACRMRDDGFRRD